MMARPNMIGRIVAEAFHRDGAEKWWPIIKAACIKAG
jgi:hypothetical protein